MPVPVAESLSNFPCAEPIGAMLVELMFDQQAPSAGEGGAGGRDADHASLESAEGATDVVN